MGMQSIRGGDLYNRLYYSFGYLAQDGFDGQKFPILIGETGSRFIDPADLDFMSDFALWLSADPSTGLINRIAVAVSACSWGRAC